MNLCIPVEADLGLQSLVCAHFGAAPAFVIVDSESGALRVVANNNQHHAHGVCSPLAALAGQAVDSVIVGGIGMGALMKLNQAGIEVYRSTEATVEATLTAFKAGTLPRVEPGQACARHGHGHGH